MTDRQQYHGNTELRYASRGKNSKITVVIITQFQLHTVSRALLTSVMVKFEFCNGQKLQKYRYGRGLS